MSPVDERDSPNIVRQAGHCTTCHGAFGKRTRQICGTHPEKMPRELRKRASRVNYAELAQMDDEDDAEAGPSQATPTFDEEEDSGSDFTPEVAANDGGDIEADVDDDEFEDVDELSDPDGPQIGRAHV